MRFILGRHHAIAGRHAVRYLGEFAYRLSRRRRESNPFALLLDACTKVKAMTVPNENRLTYIATQELVCVCYAVRETRASGSCP